MTDADAVSFVARRVRGNKEFKLMEDEQAEIELMGMLSSCSMPRLEFAVAEVERRREVFAEMGTVTALLYNQSPLLRAIKSVYDDVSHGRM